MSAATQLAMNIISQARVLPNTLLGWDGSSEKEVVLENLKNYIHRVSGWKLLSVTVVDGVLHISNNNSQLLVYDIKGHGREIYGRVCHLGLSTTMLKELKFLI